MKKTTIIRKLDNLGRFVLPKDVRRRLNIRKGDYLELSVEEEVINIKKYSYLKELEFLVTLLIESIHSIYDIEAVLVEGENIIAVPPSNQKKIMNKIDEKEYIAAPIVLEGNEIGRFILFSKEERLLSFIVLFLRKYLEE